MQGFYGVYEDLFSRLDRQEIEAESMENPDSSSRETTAKFGEISYP